MSSAQPNTVLIVTDQQHASGLSCHGGVPVQTPNVDALAAEGKRFDRAFCVAPICSPSRASLFAGLWPHRFGAVRNGTVIPRGTPNLAAQLWSAGYRLGYAGKWHADDATVPTDHHFEGKPVVHQMLDKGPCGHDDIYRVPLVIGGGQDHGVGDELLYVQDIFPTIPEMAGADVPACDFASLAPLPGPPTTSAEKRRGLLGVFRRRLVGTHRHKLVVSAADICELYDLEQDPDELNNRFTYPDLRHVRDDLVGRLLDYLEQTEDRHAHPDYLEWALPDLRLEIRGSKGDAD